jgi:8-oxo-dGTP diphosphatase
VTITITLLIVKSTFIPYYFSVPDAIDLTKPYDSRDFPPFAVTVDIAIFTIIKEQFSLLLIQRGSEPFKGAWALPGGFVQPDEDLDTAAARELNEETSIDSASYLEQLKTYGAPDRDPRMRVVSSAYWAVVPELDKPTAGSDARHAQFVPVSKIEAGHYDLAFDHQLIVGDAVERARAKLEYSTIATSFCDHEFTLSELRQVYETVWGVELEPANFARKAQQCEGFLQPLDRTVSPSSGTGRPAQLFRLGTAIEIQPPFKRLTN